MSIVDKYYEEAQEKMKAIACKLPLTSIVLDDWGGAVRLVYGADFVADCSSNCEACLLYKTVGADSPDLKRDSFVTTLRLASPGTLEVFPSKQKHLNCKTLEQYLNAIIMWLVERCKDSDSMAAELDLARGFRVLHAGGKTDLVQVEKDCRRYVVEETLRRMGSDDIRREFLVSYSQKIGLIDAL